MARRKQSKWEKPLRVGFFLVLGFSVYWSVLLGLFGVLRFADAPSLQNGALVAFVLLFPLFAVLNLKFYLDVLAKERLVARWKKWFKVRHDEILFAIALTMAIEVFTILVYRGDVAVSEAFGPVFVFATLPTLFGEILMGVVREGTNEYFSVLSFINELGVLVGVSFQLMASYYLARFLFWASHVHREQKGK